MMNNIICVKLFYNKRLRKNLIFLIINSIVFSSFMDTIFFNLISMEKYMENKQLKNKIIEVLSVDDRLWNDNKTELNQTLLLDLVENIDEKVIELLLGEESLRDKFFVKIKDVYVFKTNDFKFFMEENKVNNSYTQYKNRIGLTDGKRFLKDSGDVVLNFPYKDCVLEGGQSNEEGLDTYFAYEEEKIKTVKGEKVTEPSGYKEKQSKRKEVFFNQVLARDEIDRLFDEKALVNWSRFTQNGEVNVGDIQRDEDGIIKENLIIKGNNLLVLHSLKSQFKGQVKLIYIDPPYYFNATKKEDAFAYNSNFKLSTWLTFMKNRLELAKELLSDTGAIFVQISDDGVAELHQLLKEVFNKNSENNFINKITVKTKSPSGFASVNAGVFETAEYILVFGKNKKLWTYNPQYIKAEYDENYKWFIQNKSEDYNNWDIVDLFEYIAQKEGFNNKKEAISKLKQRVFHQIIEEFAIENSESVFRFTAIGDDAGKKAIEARDVSKKNKETIYKVEREKHYDIYILKGQEIAFYSKKVREIDGEKVPSIQLSNIWMDTPYEGIAKEGNVTLKGGKKPEKLIRRIIEMSTNVGDIILDYHLGSGTTCAVAHKTGRQYIGVEQLNYAENDSVTRLQNVVNGDKTGISEAVKWKGGGDFIYLELAKWNEQAKEEINTCESLDDLEKLFDTLYEKYFLNYNFKVKEFKEKVINEDEFKALSLEEQKRMFLSMLDLNQMYVQKTEMEDKRFGINDEDQKLTNEFYKNEK